MYCQERDCPLINKVLCLRLVCGLYNEFYFMTVFPYGFLLWIKYQCKKLCCKNGTLLKTFSGQNNSLCLLLELNCVQKNIFFL